MISPSRGVNKKCFKPPPSVGMDFSVGDSSMSHGWEHMASVGAKPQHEFPVKKIGECLWISLIFPRIAEFSFKNMNSCEIEESKKTKTSKD